MRIRPSDTPWITTAIRKLIQKRKRTHKKAIQLGTQKLWSKFKKIRDKVVDSIRQSEKQYVDHLSNKLKSESLSSKDWWFTLKAFITLSQNASVPTLEQDGIIYPDKTDKANILNYFFRDQTLLNDQNARVPNIAYYVNRFLSTLVITHLEVESVLKSLPLGKAVGPDDENNRILLSIGCCYSNTTIYITYFD